MRRLFALGMTTAAAGCSLLVSTSGLDDGTSASNVLPDGAPELDAISPLGEAGVAPGDGGGGGGGDAAGDAPSTVELPGLIGAWLFEDGTAKDTSGKGRDGVLNGDAQVVMTDRGNAMQVNGTNEAFFAVPALELTAFPATGTISVWFKYTTINTEIEQGIFDDWSSQRAHVFVRHANGARASEMQVAFQPASSQYVFSTSFDLDVNTWAHVVVS